MKSILLSLAVLLLLTPAAPAGEHSCPPGPERLRCLAEKGDARAQYSLGMKAFEQAKSGDDGAYHREALRWFIPAAEQGYVPAQAVLGFMYWEGWGVEPDVEQAYIWFKRAGEGGYPQAERWLKRAEARLTPEQLARIKARKE